jgi:hypothetical protein
MHGQLPHARAGPHQPCAAGGMDGSAKAWPDTPSPLPGPHLFGDASLGRWGLLDCGLSPPGRRMREGQGRACHAPSATATGHSRVGPIPCVAIASRGGAGGPAGPVVGAATSRRVMQRLVTNTSTKGCGLTCCRKREATWLLVTPSPSLLISFVSSLAPLNYRSCLAAFPTPRVVPYSGQTAGMVSTEISTRRDRSCLHLFPIRYVKLLKNGFRL